MAPDLGIDVVSGEQFPPTAKVARRCGRELLTFPSWDLDGVRALRATLVVLRVEVVIPADRSTAVHDVLSRHPGTDSHADIPVDEIARHRRPTGGGPRRPGRTDVRVVVPLLDWESAPPEPAA
jgi:hypothetical protein